MQQEPEALNQSRSNRLGLLPVHYQPCSTSGSLVYAVDGTLISYRLNRMAFTVGRKFRIEIIRGRSWQKPYLYVGYIPL
jgi:hypothetical protein